MKKIVSCILSVLFTVSACFAVLFGAGTFSQADERALAAESNDTAQTGPQVKIVISVNTQNGVVQPSSDGVVYFRLMRWILAGNGNTSLAVGEVRVYYRTYDLSAVAAQGDYEATEGCLVFPASSNAASAVKTIGIKVGSKGAATTSTRNKGMLNEKTETVTRQFKVCFERIECDYGTPGFYTGSKSEYVCSAGYASMLDVTYSKGVGYYTETGKTAYSPTWTTPEIAGKTAMRSSDPYFRDDLLADNPAWRPFLESGMMQLAVGIEGEVKDDNYWEYAGECWIFLKQDPMADYLVQYVVNTDDMSSGEKGPVADHITSSSLFAAERGYYVAEGKSCMIVLKDSSSYLCHTTVIQNPDNSDDVWFWLKQRYELTDITAPTVTGYYLSDEILPGNKIGLSLRMSEPVQVTGAAPQIEGWINGSMTNTLRFDYVCGSGSDTLYFEAEIPAGLNTQINSIRMCTIANAGNITDFAKRRVEYVESSKKYVRYDGAFKLNQPAYTSVSCKYDFRTPVVSVKGTVPTAVVKSSYVLLQPENVGEGATLYYTWTDDEADPVSYDYSVPVTLKTDKTGTTAASYTVTGQNMNGKKYLHAKIVSAQGKEGKTHSGPYKFDSTPPAIQAVMKDTSTLVQRDYTVGLTDGEGEIYSGLADVYVLISTNADGSDAKSKLVFAGNGERTKTVDYSLTAGDLGLAENEFGTFYIAFSASDKAGNKTEPSAYDFVAYRFDRRQTFSTAFVRAETDEGGDALLEKTADGSLVIDLSAGAALYFTAENSLTPSVSTFIGADGAPCTAYEETTGASALTLSLKNVPAGYYEILLHTTDGGTEKVSELYCVYLTQNGQEDTALYRTVQRGTLLVNQVYQLSEIPYYYKDSAGEVKTLSYGNTILPASFSSYYEARSYVYFMELQDLYAVRLDETMATALNEGVTSNFVKARNETVVARAGQIWIRYKSDTWQSNSSSNAWVYYYYDTASDVIDLGKLSNNLAEALNQVSDRICGYGSTAFLAGEGKLNALGEPYLAPAQIHSGYESALQTMCGNAFVSEISYQGDRWIYDSTATEGGAEYPIASNLPLVFGAHTKLYYKSSLSTAFTEIKRGSGNYLSDLLNVTGVYQIKELGDEGMRLFSVYVDANAPVLLVSLESSDGSIRSITLDESAAGIAYNAKSFVIGSISALEKDEYAYVAVYRYVTSTTGTLLKVYTRDELEGGGIALESGNYHIEVSDRSGNSYTFIVRVNSSDFECAVTETENSYIRVTCNRTEEQIAAYEIYLNGKLYEATYSQSAKFTESGYYRIYIRDLYGNVFDQEVEFIRSIPSVLWKYNVNGGYVSYDEETATQMRITKTDDKTYVIKTSTTLQFSYDGEYSYSFSSGVDYSESLISHVVTVKTLSNFELKVWYTAHPDIYVNYVCAIDNTPPTIQVRREIVTYTVGEGAEILEQIESGEEGDLVSYTQIGYSRKSSTERYVTEGETVCSRLIRVSVSDSGGVARVLVYLDGKLFLDTTERFTDVVLSRYGKYTIDAYDIFGNLSRFSFENQKQDALTYSVDDVVQETDFSCLEYFREGEYLKKEYGNGSVSLSLNYNAQVVLKISRNGGEAFVTALEAEEGNLYAVTYRIAYSLTGLKEARTVRSEPLLSASDPARSAGEWYLIFTEAEAGAQIYASFGADGNFSLKIENDSSSAVYSVEGRITADTDGEPFYFRCELSSLRSDVLLTDNAGETVETNQNWKQIKINKGFTVSPSCAADEKILSVKVFYSLTGDYGEPVVVYDGEYSPIAFSAEGLYLVEILNIYGNTTYYFLMISEHFIVTTVAEFSDGVSVNYSVEYSEPVYCNGKIYLMAYGKSVVCSVLSDGEDYRGYSFLETEDFMLYIIEEEGEYEVTLTDEYGNVFRREIGISSQEIADDDSLLYGYNESALKRAEGYTNRKLSVSADRMREDGIVYVSVSYGNETVVLYDLISEKKIALDEAVLFDCVGNTGDGEYVVVFRNAYGNRLVKMVNYRAAPTLLLSRATRSSAEEEYDLEKALSLGLWSNNTLSFATDAAEYEFRVDGLLAQCPYVLQFGSGAEEGSFEYAISYVDEYGFSYEIKAHLYRKKIEISLSPSVSYITVEGTPVTREDLSVRFDESAKCVYSLGGGEDAPYLAGDTLYRDGVYRFTAVDLAGNVAAYTVKKDSAVRFELLETATDNLLVNGEIACTNRVAFRAKDGDDAYISKVFLDGVLQKDYTDNKFSESGRWELILADGAGNEAYFCFYILTHPVKEFSYTSPYNYKITEVWYDAGDGIRLSYMQFVSGNGTVCSFTENGIYSVVMSSAATGDVANFSVTVNNVAPQVSLVGCEENETTLNDVTVKGYKVGDTIELYRNGKLMRSVKILTSTTDAPVVNEGGQYTFVVRNEAGVETSLSFKRKHIPNTAGNILIFAAILGAIAVISIGLAYRNHSKSDE